MKNESPVSPLSALLSILTKSINTLESAYSEANLQYPSLDAPFAPTPLDGNPELIQATRHAVAAAAQIIATIRVPIETVQEYSTSSYAAASLNLVVETNVANILKDAGEQVHTFEALCNSCLRLNNQFAGCSRQRHSGSSGCLG